ncbi:MAG: amylo-alpha-1,6-glucosidase [Chloroflexales bacterium]|nr:amylo-alpha-1,6-glucosidase [Chloroflexales bacterium]
MTQASSTPSPQQHVLKQGEGFALFDHFGDSNRHGQSVQGLYHEDTRFLSRLELRINGTQPLFLSSGVREDNLLLEVDLTNPDLAASDMTSVPSNTIHLARAKLLWQGVCYEQLTLTHHGQNPVALMLTVHFAADFADIFEVRGVRRERRGQHLDPRVAHDQVVLSYHGLDGVVRQSTLDFAPTPTAIGADSAAFALHLQPQQETTLSLTIRCELEPQSVTRHSFGAALAGAEEALRVARSQECAITTSNPQFNAWLERSYADLHMLMTETEAGPYPYAGVPWYSTAFGRDGIITALEMLWVNPGIGRGVLGYLAARQAQQHIPAQDAEPGKILHETRKGETAALGEVPFAQYYGGVDTTPLFIMLAAAYYHHSADLPFIESIWPHLDQALRWIDEYGDLDGDGFVEYVPNHRGLTNQGWKDSGDSVFHADGTLAKGPVALCEVQGYVYAAKRGAAELAQALSATARAAELTQQARALQIHFEEAFWCEELATYALALDGEKQPCRVRSSNAGHCLFTGIAAPERAARIARWIMTPDSFSGWGIRTIPTSETRYNPMSYHNGSIWPHDTALIVAGLARYGLMEPVNQALVGLFELSTMADSQRLPELFCGFPRRPGAGPILYPVACAPQAWAVASVFLLLQACLGLSVFAPNGQVRLGKPMLPPFLDSVQIKNMRVGAGLVDLVCRRAGQTVVVDVSRRVSEIEVIQDMGEVTK